jgi:hypothetical protein
MKYLYWLAGVRSIQHFQLICREVYPTALAIIALTQPLGGQHEVCNTTDNKKASYLSA